MKKFQRIISAVTAAVMTCSMAVIGAVSSSTAKAADKTAIELVNDMGLGWNLGNTFDCWNTRGWTTDTETAWGNATTTQAMIDAVHAQGFDSIRIPITWYENLADTSTYDINDAYLARIKEVIDYAYNNDMYVIINMHWDWVSDGSLWLNKGKEALPQFTTMWTEIANYFKDYDSHLVFEDMNEVTFDYDVLNEFNQTFVNTIRTTGGNNSDRLLLLAGANDDLTKTCSPEYIVPDDDMVAVSIHYYYPSTWAVASISDPNAEGYWGYQRTWGTDEEKQDVYNLFAKLKANFADKGIPVILGEYGVITNKDKDHDSIVDYLNTIGSSALATDGVTAFLWDAGDAGDMQYYSRKNLSWFNQDYANVYKKLKENGTPIKFEYDIKTTTASSDRSTVTLSGSPDYSVDLTAYAGQGVTLKQVILNGTPGGGFGISFPATNTDGSHRDWTSEGGAVGDDGTVTIDLDGVYDASNEATGEKWTEDYIPTWDGTLNIMKWWGTDGATLDSVTLVFDKEITYTTYDISVKAVENTDPKPTTEPTTEETTEEPTTEEPTTEDVTYATEATYPDTSEETTEPVLSGKAGDATDDGEVDIRDVILVNKAIFGKETLDKEVLSRIDFNKNQMPDAEDSLNILKYTVKLVTDEQLASMLAG